MKPSEIRSKEQKELAKLLEEKRKDLFNLQLKKSVGGLADLSALGKARKDIARLQTVVRQAHYTVVRQAHYTVLKEKEMRK